MNDDFHFLRPPKLQDGDLTLALAGQHPADPERGFVPWYEFDMRNTGSERKMGSIRLRIGSARELRCPSHIGYEVNRHFRGNRYAARSVRLLLPFAAANGIKVVWITCTPNNTASRRSIEIAGLKYVETIRVPKEHPMNAEGFRHLRRYRISLRSLSNKVAPPYLPKAALRLPLSKR